MMLGSRHSQHSFSQIPDVNMARSKFDRSYTIKDTLEFDYLTPIFLEEIIPGDTINLNLAAFARLAPQVKPIMDNMYLDYFFFFIPNRLVWTNWERMCGAQDDPGDSIDFTVPQLVAPVTTGFEVGSIMDHLGLPTGIPGISVTALPFRGYYLTYNSWFRDQNLINSYTVYTDDGPDLYSDYALLKRCRKHDYFASALPSPQRGTAISMPLGTTAPILSDGTAPTFSSAAAGVSNSGFTWVGAGDQKVYSIANPTGAGTMIFGGNSGLYADLSSAASATINQLRLAFMTQSLLELDARAGTRYVEILRAHFNVVSPDFRLQRPEFLGGGTTALQQHVVAQTSETSVDSPQGNLAAFSTSAVQGNQVGFSKSFVEHGYVLGMVQARGEVTYQQGVNRMWSRSSRYDFFWPKLQELGEQTILNKEIYAQGTAGGSADAGTFGYQERYAEYRYHPSEIRGQFRSSFAQSLDVWHLAQEYGSLPTLNANWIASNTPMERVLVTPPEPENADAQILFDCFFKLMHARPMMTYGVPATMGRF